MNYLNVLAKALYDNVAESADELSFRKGDILTVLERDTQGLDGWWLCSLHGRQGIVPGNRLKILAGMYDSKLQQQAATVMPDPAASCASSQEQRPLPPNSPYTRLTHAAPPSASITSFPGFPSKPTLSTHHTPMQVFPGPSPPNLSTDPVYMMPPSHVPQVPPQSLYQVSPGQDGPLPQNPPGPPSIASLVRHRQYQDIYSVPPSLGLELASSWGGPATQDLYQVPPPLNLETPSGGKIAARDLYQVPPSLEKRIWDSSSSKMQAKVVVPTRVGQVYVYDTVKPPQDTYNILPRHLPHRQQDIYDVPPTRQQCSTQVYDFPPSVSKDVFEAQSVQEETYDIPPHFAKLKSQGPTPFDKDLPHHTNKNSESPILEEVYDIPPPILTGKHYPGNREGVTQEIYDIPAGLNLGGHLAQDVYNLSHDHEDRDGERREENIYDIPPQVLHDVQATSEELSMSLKRLSASSTGSTRSNHSVSSLDLVPVKDITSLPVMGRPLLLDLDQAMERLSRLQQAVESNVSLMMSFITGNWRNVDCLEGTLPAIHQAADRVRSTVRDLLEFASSAVANAAQASDRSLHIKLGRQVGKMEEMFQSLIQQIQSLDALSWSHIALSEPPLGGDELDRLIMTARGIPDDAKQLASFLHGNASLLFKRTGHQQQLPLPPIPGEISHMTESGSGSYKGGERVSIQSRPLPSPPKFTATNEEEGVEPPYESTEAGWMEDYDYVHLQGKEEFEKNQRQLLEKGNIIRHNKSELEQQQIKQFEYLEQEVSRPINNDMTGWMSSSHKPPAHHNMSGGSASSKLCHSDQQLLLFYQEQCEQNVTSVTNAIDAFFTATSTNQPPKIFVAHSKFVILSAHKLVFIGDTLSRQAKAPEVRSRVSTESNILCQKLKDIVVSTKTAALQYPSPTAAHDMTERVTELAACMQQFRMMLGHLLAM